MKNRRRDAQVYYMGRSGVQYESSEKGLGILCDAAFVKIRE